MSKTIAILFGTFFGIGYLPFIPGTFGSMAGVVLFYLFNANTAAYILFTFILIILGILIGRKIEEIFGRKDPPCVVIDEVAGMLLALVFIKPDIKLVILGFVFFRLLDTLKPYPAGRLQGLRGGLGIVTDDVVAGIYTNLILHAILKFASFTAS